MSDQHIVEILVRRDGISELEARNTVDECRAELAAAIADGCSILEAEDIVADYLGLEPDYLMDLLY